MGPEVQLLVVTLMFLGLLTAGMPVPFAIVIPAVIYLFLQGGLAALNSLGLVSWGSMNVFALTAVPLFMFMAEILSASGLSTRIYGGLAKLVAQAPRRSAADQYRRLRGVCLRQWLEHRHRGNDRRRRAAAAARARLQSAAGRGLARCRRHARHPDPAKLSA